MRNLRGEGRLVPQKTEPCQHEVNAASTRTGESGQRDFGVTISNGHRETSLPDIYAEESRPGWLNLILPPLEIWHEPLARLPNPMRARIESPEFYQNLHRVVSTRFQTAKQQR